MKITWQGQEVEADRVEFRAVEEPFARHLILENGGELLLKIILVDVWKLREAAPDGTPQYVTKSQNVVHYRPPESPQRLQ